VGAYYYLWNPQALSSGTLRAHLVPSQVPPSSLVDSMDTGTAERDITNAHRAGIDFFAIDWWPYNAGHSGADNRWANGAMRAFLRASNLKEMKFAMFYETWNLGFDPARESTPVTPQMELHFDADMIEFADRYFHNPSYLRIDGRPVVFLYLTRTLTGDVGAMIQGARTVLAARGFDPFFIGDEVYWRVTPETPAPGGPVLTTTPQVNRIDQFDALTSYTLYYGDPSAQFGPTRDSGGYPGLTNIVADQRFLLTVYRNATDGRVPVIPDVGVGFNDRGFRLLTNHPAEPRQWLPGEGPASTLDHFFRCVAIPELDPALPMVMVTSWNDWNEDTGIEPIPGRSTRVDDSPTGNWYTQGYQYGGEGTSALRTLRRDTKLLDAVVAGHARSSKDRTAKVSVNGSTDDASSC
jgi:glycoprotein endo-alpha-1,2-mannosidase